MKNKIFFIVVLYFLSCSESGNEKQTVKIEKDKFGVLISEISYLNDTLKHGIAKYYFYNSKQISREKNYDRGKLNGVEKYYYENGNLFYSKTWKQNKLHGKVINFRENGSKRSEEIFNEGIRLSYVSYLENGNKEFANYNDLNGDIFVKRYMVRRAV